MLKSIGLLIVRLVVLTLFFVQVTLTFNINPVFAQEMQPLNSASSPTKETLSPTQETPASTAEQTTETQPISPQEATQKPPTKGQKVTYPTAPHPYDMEAIEKFNEELYGN